MSRFAVALSVGILGGFLALVAIFYAPNPALGIDDWLLLVAPFAGVAASIVLLLRSNGRCGSCCGLQRDDLAEAPVEITEASPDRY